MHRRHTKFMICFALILLFASSVLSQETVDPVVSVPGIEVSTSVDFAEVYIGDLITYTVSITYDSTYQLIPPPLGANLGAFDVKDYEPDISTMLEDGRRNSKTIFKVATFTTGDYQIPALPVIFILPDSSRQMVLADPVPIKVLSLLTDTTDSLDIRPLKAQHEFEIPIDPVYYWGGGGLALLLIALIVWLIWRRRKLAGEPIDDREAWEIAFEKLAMLKARNYRDTESFKHFYFELTEILRGFLGRIYKIDALEMTTEECKTAFALVRMPSGSFDQMLAFMKEADLVKFARFDPGVEKLESDFKFVHDLIDAVRVDEDRRRQMALTAEKNRQASKPPTTEEVS